MVFETYIFKYFKVRIVDSHSLGFCMCVFGVCIAVFTSDGGSYVQTISKCCAIEKHGILKTNTQLQYCETRGKGDTRQETFLYLLIKE